MAWRGRAVRRGSHTARAADQSTRPANRHVDVAARHQETSGSAAAHCESRKTVSLFFFWDGETQACPVRPRSLASASHVRLFVWLVCPVVH